MDTWKDFFHKMISIRFLAFLFGFLLGGLLVNVAVAAWSGPSCGPTGCNVEEPINKSTDTQTKEGGLNIANSTGRVGIGTSSPHVQLTVEGNANICHLVTYDVDTGTTDCPSGYFTWAGEALDSGTMLCCKVDNPL